MSRQSTSLQPMAKARTAHHAAMSPIQELVAPSWFFRRIYHQPSTSSSLSTPPLQRLHATGQRRTVRPLQAVPIQLGDASKGSMAVTSTPTPPRVARNKELPGHWEEQMKKSKMGKKRVLEPYLKRLAAINALEPEMMALSNEELRGKTDELKARLAAGHQLDSLLEEAFAVVREASRRVLNMRHFDAQLVGGMVLHDGQIAEMATGEGKTLVATLPAYLNALEGQGVHIVTVNDYLAARDAAWMGKLYRFLGLTCAAVQSTMTLPQFQHAYSCDITYVTGQQLGFSYLGDNTSYFEAQLVLPDTWHYALVDEVDSILIDESRNPMIISLPQMSDTKVVKIVDKVVRSLYELVQEEKEYRNSVIEMALEKARRQGAPQGTLKVMQTQYQEIAKKQCSFLYAADHKQKTAIPTTAGLFVLYAGLQFMGADLPLPSMTMTSSYSSDSDEEAEELASFEQVLVQRVAEGNTDAAHMILSDPNTLANLLKHPVSRPMLLRAPHFLDQILADPVAVSVLERELRSAMNKEERHQQELASRGKNRQSTEALQSLWDGAVKWGRLITTALQVYEFYQEGRDYIVKDGEVVVIDSSTGRLRSKSRWPGGLHQAVEAKESVALKDETVTIAQITFQVFFSGYKKLAGMTGTASPAAGELFELYGLKVVQIPTNKPNHRKDRSTRIYLRKPDKFRFLVSEVLRCWRTKRPLLIGTATVAESELILDVLHKYTGGDELCQSVQLLNAKPEKVRIESQIIAQAGLPGSVTIATNMAGRGTDIVLGGNPEGLTKLVLMRLVYRRLMAGPDQDSIPPIPLRMFDAFDKAPLGPDSNKSVSEWISETREMPAGLKLPEVLRLALIAPLLLTSVGSAQNLSYEKASEMVGWVMEQAFVLHREVLQRISRTYGDRPIEDLEYSVCVAAAAEELLREKEESFLSATQGQQFVLKAALLLWLWLDQTCARYAEEVREVGGLLVIGTSLQESKRVELQLRGRAGRQGDPGETIMLCDSEDPLLEVYSQGAGISKMLSSSALADLQFLEGLPTDRLIVSTQHCMESVYQMARLEGKKYDLILEDYRSSMYTLRRLMLTGSVQQRTQVIYMFIQHLVDSLCAQYLDPSEGPSHWITPSIPLSRLGGGLGPQPSLARPEADANQGPLLSPLEALLRKLHQLVNPPSSVPQTQVEFKTLKDGIVHDVTVQKVLSLFQGVTTSEEGGPLNGSTAGGSRSSTSARRRTTVDVAVDMEEVPILGPGQANALAQYLPSVQPHYLAWMGGGADKEGHTLPLPAAPYQQTFKQALALATHLRIFGMEVEGSSGGPSASDANMDAFSLPPELAASLVQRPSLSGPYAHKVLAVRNFLGVSMLHAYEMRRTSVRSMLLTKGFALTDIDAEYHVSANEQEVLLQWIDALWSCFLEEAEKLKRAVNLRSYASKNPKHEFRIEANRSFLACLDAYREAVVELVLAPSMSFAVPVNSLAEDVDPV